MSDSEKVVAELRRIAKVGFGYDINDHDRRALRSAADLIAKQAATIAARDDELIGERWHADEAARQRDVVKAALAAAKAEKERLRDALEPFAREADAALSSPATPEPVSAPAGEVVEALRRERQTFADAAVISVENDRLREALHDLLTRPTDGAARVRARAALSEKEQGG